MDRADNTAMAIALISYENDKRLHALPQDVNKATFIDFVTGVAFIAADIATATLGDVLGGNMEPKEARDNFIKAIDAMLLGIEIDTIEGSAK